MHHTIEVSYYAKCRIMGGRLYVESATIFHLELVYTMNHEVGPWKMAFSMVQLPRSDFSKKYFTKAFGPLARCKPNVDQEE